MVASGVWGGDRRGRCSDNGLEKADIGLHFTLTADRPIGSVLRDAYLRRLDAGATALELERQLAIFWRVTEQGA